MNARGRTVLFGTAIALLLGCSDQIAPPDPPPLTLVADSTTNDQVVAVVTLLGRPLRVQVQRAGAPAAGVTVSWATTSGDFFFGEASRTQAATSLTDGSGVAAMQWRPGTKPGIAHLTATIGSSANQSVAFRATVVAGPAVSLRWTEGLASLVFVDSTKTRVVGVRAVDAWQNVVVGQPVTWRVEPDSVARITSEGVTNELGESAATIRPRSSAGAGVVVASMPGRDLSVSVPISVVSAATPMIFLDTDNLEFRSARNGSHPAVDTVTVGATVFWSLVPFDYDSHGIVSVGAPTFAGGGEFPYADPSVVAATFSQPGTYRYADMFNSKVVGTIVVR